MTLFRGLKAVALIVALTLSAGVARAADLIVVDGSPALLYEFGEFERRGVVLADGGEFLVREDGCFFAAMEVVNPSDFDRSVSIVLRFSTPRGHPYASVVILDPTLLPAGDTVVVADEGCNSAFAAAFPDMRNYGTRRVFSVR